MSELHPDIASLLGPVAPLPLATSAAGAPPAGSAVPAGGATLAINGGAYDGAKRFDELSLFYPPMQSADADILPDKDLLDARTRDIMRNDAYVQGGARLRQDNIVGAIYLLNCQPKTKILWGKEDDAWEEEFQEEVESKFMLAAESPRHWFDVQRVKTLTEMVRLGLGVHTMGGEVLASAEWVRTGGRPFKTAIQMIDADRLSTPWDKQWSQDIRGGVERDRGGGPIAYHIRNRHPSDYASRWDDGGSKWTRVPAYNAWGRQMVLHVYEQLRPDQTRGISSMVAALAEMKMTKGFRKVELQRAVVAATYAASMESDLPSHEVLAMMGGADGNGTDDAATKYMLQYLSSIEAYSGGSQSLYLDGVKIPVLMPGTKLKLQNPGNGGPMGDKFEQSLLRHIAAALGVSYEQLSRDYTQTNYSSARAAMGETWKFMQSLKKVVADKVANFVFRLWFEEAINTGQIETLKRRNVPNFYEGLNADAYTACEWIGAGQGLIDPYKETQAYKLQVDSGFTTRERVIARLYGGDWRKEIKQMAREKRHIERNGLSFDPVPPAGAAASNDSADEKDAA